MSRLNLYYWLYFYFVYLFTIIQSTHDDVKQLTYTTLKLFHSLESLQSFLAEVFSEMRWNDGFVVVCVVMFKCFLSNTFFLPPLHTLRLFSGSVTTLWTNKWNITLLYILLGRGVKWATHTQIYLHAFHSDDDENCKL